jgi:hypothetical protein
MAVQKLGDGPASRRSAVGLKRLLSKESGDAHIAQLPRDFGSGYSWLTPMRRLNDAIAAVSSPASIGLTA